MSLINNKTHKLLDKDKLIIVCYCEFPKHMDRRTIYEQLEHANKFLSEKFDDSVISMVLPIMTDNSHSRRIECLNTDNYSPEEIEKIENCLNTYKELIKH